MTGRRGRSYYEYGWRFPPRSTPREVEGGIKSQSKRGAFGESWWAKRWIEVLESFNIGARLSRGKSYARRGQVLSIDIEQGMVTAAVQGSRKRPYMTAIQVKEIPAAGWKKVAKALSKQAIFTARLLAGEMPDNIEKAFEKAGVSLFPEKRGDLKTDCSCPDWSNPCKHIAAVYYLLGEEFDRDPFLIFRLRGMEREHLVELIAANTDEPQEQSKGQRSPLRAEPEPAANPPEPLPTDPEMFWGTIAEPCGRMEGVVVPELNAALPRRLGKFPFWSGEEDFITAMEGIYYGASQVGFDVFLRSLGGVDGGK